MPALLVHMVFHPYISGRQFRLELWSLITIVVTLAGTLFIPTLSTDPAAQKSAYILSFFVLFLNVIVLLAFLFFIGRGLVRRFTPKLWDWIGRAWNRLIPQKIKPKSPEYSSMLDFFKSLADATEYDQQILYNNLEEWFKSNPNYKRRRLLQDLVALSKGTPIATFHDKSSLFQNRNSGLDSNRSSMNIFGAELPTL